MAAAAVGHYGTASSHPVLAATENNEMGCSNSKDEAVARGGAGWPKKASKDGGANGGSRLGVVTGDLRYNMLKATKTANFEELYEVLFVCSYALLVQCYYK